MFEGEHNSALLEPADAEGKSDYTWEALPADVRNRWLQIEGNRKERWESLTTYEQEEFLRQYDLDFSSSGGSLQKRLISVKASWPNLPKRLRDIWQKEDPSNTSDKWLSLDQEIQKNIKAALTKKLQALESVPIPWEEFDYRDLWMLEYETNSERTWNAIPPDLQRKIVKRLRKSLSVESVKPGSVKRTPIRWDKLERELQELFLKSEGNTPQTWAELLPRDQRKERERLKRQLAKKNKKQEQEMRKKARLTPNLLNAWLAEERTLIEWLSLPTQQKLHEMQRLNNKLAKTQPKNTPEQKSDGVKRRRGRPFGATSSSKRAKTAARAALGGKAQDAFKTIAGYQEETRTAGVEKDNMMCLIQAYKGSEKKGRGRPRKDDLHNRLIFRVFGPSLNDMKTLLKQAYHQVKSELDILNNEAEINPQVKLAKHEILFDMKDIEKSFLQENEAKNLLSQNQERNQPPSQAHQVQRPQLFLPRFAGTTHISNQQQQVGISQSIPHQAPFYEAQHDTR